MRGEWRDALVVGCDDLLHANSIAIVLHLRCKPRKDGMGDTNRAVTRLNVSGVWATSVPSESTQMSGVTSSAVRSRSTASLGDTRRPLERELPLT